ncbi:MAG TPA: phosphoribosyltransferase [Gemmatimonadaceae bacterium]|nr:phosphoribosyltransferase [Gemmatimonadaceae bacterium]
MVIALGVAANGQPTTEALDTEDAMYDYNRTSRRPHREFGVFSVRDQLDTHDDAFFEDRADAGRRLADRLRPLATLPELIVLGLPRGGVPVASEVAEALGVPLDTFVVRKLGVPGHEELAMGAIASGGVRIINWPIVRQLNVPAEAIERAAQAERIELERRDRAYRGERLMPDLRGRSIIVVDDGLATGASMSAAVAALREHLPALVIAAVPVGSREACALLQQQADACICVTTPEPFRGVGQWYGDFSQTTDDEVRALLDRAALREERRSAERG